MNKILCLLVLHVCLVAASRAEPTPISNQLNNMWLQGNKAGVLAIANQRIHANPSDIPGLVMALEYQMTYCDITNISVTIDKIVSVGAAVNTQNFSHLYSKLRGDLLHLLNDVLPNVTPQIAQAEAYKGDIAGKPLSLLYVLQALELDGLFQ